MNEVIAELPKSIPNAYVISSAGCQARRDHLHFTAEGYRELGKRYGEKMVSLLGYEVEKPKEPETPGPTTYCNPISLPDYPLGRRARDVTVGRRSRRTTHCGWWTGSSSSASWRTCRCCGTRGRGTCTPRWTWRG